ncbi:MAG: hypothetical protein QN194_15400 [Armatimonadota bacterium]|nr:hypothetical protein [Armatimonadota bacterium]
MRGMASWMWITLLELLVGMLFADMVSQRLQQTARAIARLISW